MSDRRWQEYLRYNLHAEHRRDTPFIQPVVKAMSELVRQFGTHLRLIGLLICAGQAAAFAASSQADEPVRFAIDIAPIFAQHCVRCHSAENEKGKISLATFEDLEEKQYVVAGDPDSSYLIELITAAAGERPKMPQDGKSLSDEQVDLIRRWITEGAKWPDGVTVRKKWRPDKSWWSLQPLSVGRLSESSGHPSGSPATTIDDFILAKLAEQGLTLNPPAGRRTLIRRVTYDLTGLPPLPEEVEAFVNDSDPRAYELLVERLLNSPRYGERWGRHWLDVVRFGESRGFERNEIINDIWPFRDYVIRSLNEDKPIGQLIREHLAGDVFGKDDPDVEVGSAFLVAGPYDDVGNQDPVQAAQIRANTIDEIIRATGEAFLGLTIGCARCHDHKFDPILQRDYYSLYATFAGIRHGSRVVATSQEKATHAAMETPLTQRLDELTKQRDALTRSVMKRAQERVSEHRKRWKRKPTRHQGTEETFSPVEARFVRLVSEGQDADPQNVDSFSVDEFDVWSAEEKPRNVALAVCGAKASGPSRVIEDFPGAYGPQLAIDGKTGARFLATGGHLTIELAKPTRINRVFFSNARGQIQPQQQKFAFVADYRIEVSDDGQNWIEVANGRDRMPVNSAHRDKRLRELEITQAERARSNQLNWQIAAVERTRKAVPPLRTVWVGERSADDAKGPFHVFLGGSPQRKGDPVVPASLSALAGVTPGYRFAEETAEVQRRQALADWIVHPDNPLTPRVLSNRIWQYHFGTGLVDTPSDFGYMGGRPTHPELLDWLAQQLLQGGWRLKVLHKQIMMSRTYRQSSDYRESAAKLDGDSRLLWRFPPRRLSAEEIRDTMLSVSGKLDTQLGGPGFRLYRYLQDNVATYVPLDEHGPETYRRAVYHQNARAARTDLMTEFDQPDCAFSTPRRAETTTPLQALTALNHDFTLDMARALAERLEKNAGDNPMAQVRTAFALCYGRHPHAGEVTECVELIRQVSLAAFCRVMLNTSELIYVE